MDPKPMVSVLCITYNQEEFIRDALEGFVKQTTDFDYNVMISDDASTDKTQEIIREYEIEYPEIIKPLYRKKNVGANKNFFDTFNRCDGKYIAWCDGDDYWTDPKKLQKQVGFLEAHPEYSMASHAVKTLFIGVEEKDPFVKPLKSADFKQIYEHGHFIPSMSIVFRKKAFPEIPPWFRNLWVSDLPLILMVTTQGKNYYFDDIMGIKRKNTKSISQEGRRQQREYKEYVMENRIYFYRNMNKYFNNRHQKVIYPWITEQMMMLVLISIRKGKVLKGLKYFLYSFFISPKTFIKKAKEKIS